MEDDLQLTNLWGDEADDDDDDEWEFEDIECELREWAADLDYRMARMEVVKNTPWDDHVAAGAWGLMSVAIFHGIAAVIDRFS